MLTAASLPWGRSIAVLAENFEYALRQMGKPAMTPEHENCFHNREYLLSRHQ